MYTTNITGLRHCTRGSSLRTDSTAAGQMSARSNIDSLPRRTKRGGSAVDPTGPHPAGPDSPCVVLLEPSDVTAMSATPESQMLDDGPERQRRHEGERADQQHRADQQNDERRPIGRHGAGRHGNALLLRERAG